jgi:hypothetical protein
MDFALKFKLFNTIEENNSVISWKLNIKIIFFEAMM